MLFSFMSKFITSDNINVYIWHANKALRLIVGVLVKYYRA